MRRTDHRFGRLEQAWQYKHGRLSVSDWLSAVAATFRAYSDIMHDTAFMIFSLVAMLLVAIPTSWHWRAGNVGTLMSIGWIFIANLIFFVNSILWMDNVSNWAPVWCDISQLQVVLLVSTLT
jgi:hypothetical protein